MYTMTFIHFKTLAIIVEIALGQMHRLEIFSTISLDFNIYDATAKLKSPKLWPLVRKIHIIFILQNSYWFPEYTKFLYLIPKTFVAIFISLSNFTCKNIFIGVARLLVDWYQKQILYIYLYSNNFSRIFRNFIDVFNLSSYEIGDDHLQ